MTQKRKEGESENVIGRMSALRWEPTHVTKHSSRVVPLYMTNGPVSKNMKLGLGISS